MTPTLLPVLALPLAVAFAAPAERVVTDTTLVTVVSGTPVRLLIDPGAMAMPIVTADVAARAGLKPGPFAFGFRVGPVTVAARSAVGRITLGATPVKRRIGWTERPYASGHDGAIGPCGLPEPIVRFALRPPQAGERTASLPMTGDSGLGGNWDICGAMMTIGNQPVEVRFSLLQDHTMATAGTAVVLSKTFGGTLDEDRKEAEVVFGVKRPVRTLRLARPFDIGPVAVTSLLARTSDFGNAEGIAATGTRPDPDEVVVTAKGKQDRRGRIVLGRAALADCSSIVFDRPAKVIRLSCL